MVNTKELLVNFLADPIHNAFDNSDIKVNIVNPELVLVTAAGTITGVPLKSDDVCADDCEPEEYFSDTMFSAIHDILEKNDETKGSTIILKDAQMLTGSGNTFNYKYLYVFLDDVIGVTIRSC